jgi:hypothetical protein
LYSQCSDQVAGWGETGSASYQLTVDEEQMTDLNPQTDPTGTPEDVATLYSWANLHGAKYRDFSAARAQTREKARLRAEQAAEEQSQQGQAETDAAQAAEAQAAEIERAAEEARAAEAARLVELAAEQAAFEAELAAQREAEQAAQLAAQQAVEHAARLQAEQSARQAAEQAAQEAAEQAARRAAQHAEEQAAQLARQRAAQQAAARVAEQLAQQRAWQQPPAERFPAPPQQPPAAPSYPQQGQTFDNQNYSRPQAYRPAPSQPQYPSAREENFAPRTAWAAPDSREPVGRPAWLSADQPETPGPYVPAAPLPQPPYSQPQTPQSFPQAPQSFTQAPEDTLQGSRDRLTSRWFALRGVFDGAPAPVEAAPSPQIARAPSMAIFSLAGGVGKTSLVATLGRALSARGERVLLVDTAAFGLLPFFFGATDQRPGLLRTFSPSGSEQRRTHSDGHARSGRLGSGNRNPGQESLTGEIAKFRAGEPRHYRPGNRFRRNHAAHHAHGAAGAGAGDSGHEFGGQRQLHRRFFEHNSNPAGKPSLPFYVLNQFDASLPLHLDVREVCASNWATALPFALRRTPAMSEALAEGMTVMDYAPNSTLAEDFATLAGWVKSLSAPATTSYRGVRWSER